MRRFVALQRAWLEEQQFERQFQRQLIGQLRCDVINFSLCHPERLIQLDDVVPPLPAVRHDPGRRERPARMTKKARVEVANALRRLFAGQGEQK